MRAGDGDALLEPHQFGQHLGAANDGNAPRARRDEFGIVALDRGRDDDDRGRAEIGRVVADEDGRALLAQALDVGVVARVRALDLMAEVEQHLGDARHADAADADEMDGADLARQFHAAPLPRGPAAGPNSCAGRNRRVRAVWEMGASRSAAVMKGQSGMRSGGIVIAGTCALGDAAIRSRQSHRLLRFPCNDEVWPRPQSSGSRRLAIKS